MTSFGPLKLHHPEPRNLKSNLNIAIANTLSQVETQDVARIFVLLPCSLQVENGLCFRHRVTVGKRSILPVLAVSDRDTNANHRTFIQMTQCAGKAGLLPVG